MTNITDCELISGTPESATEPHDARTLIHPTAGLMSEVEDGIFVAWDTCRRCRKYIPNGGCKCPDGPQEPEYITRWRQARFATSLTDRLTPRLPLPKGIDLDVRQNPAPPSPSVEQGLDAALEAVKAADRHDEPEREVPGALVTLASRPNRVIKLSNLLDAGALRVTEVDEFLDIELYVNDDPNGYDRDGFIGGLVDNMNELVGEGIAITVSGAVFADAENMARASSLDWTTILQSINLNDLAAKFRIAEGDAQ